jgi:hypothetical protein
MGIDKLDPTLKLLFVGMVFFTAILIFIEFRFRTDAQVFQVVASLVAGFSGAFFGRINPHNTATPGTTETTLTTTRIPPDPPPTVPGK